MDVEECALWDRIVADYLDSPHCREIISSVLAKATGTDIERASLAFHSAVSVGASSADMALIERRKRFTAVPVNDWKHAKFQVTVGTCCYCELWPVHVYRRGNAYFGCEKCTGLAPQEALSKLPDSP